MKSYKTIYTISYFVFSVLLLVSLIFIGYATRVIDNKARNYIFELRLFIAGMAFLIISVNILLFGIKNHIDYLKKSESQQT